MSTEVWVLSRASCSTIGLIEALLFSHAELAGAESTRPLRCWWRCLKYSVKGCGWARVFLHGL